MSRTCHGVLICFASAVAESPSGELSPRQFNLLLHKCLPVNLKSVVTGAGKSLGQGRAAAQLFLCDVSQGEEVMPSATGLLDCLEIPSEFASSALSDIAGELSGFSDAVKGVGSGVLLQSGGFLQVPVEGELRKTGWGELDFFSGSKGIEQLLRG